MGFGYPRTDCGGNFPPPHRFCLKFEEIKSEEKQSLKGKELMKCFMKRWIPAADALLELIVNHLPSPVQAQRYRVSNLYEGPLDCSSTSI